MKISAVIITQNEEANIGRCLDSLQGVADEVIVVDSGSTDATERICREKGANFHFNTWKGYSAQKNFANELARHEYILSLDADEVLSEELREELLRIKDSLSGTYSMNRLTNYCGHWVRHSGWYPDRKLRLFPKQGTKWVGEFVHEELEFDQEMKDTVLKGDLLHYSYHSVEAHHERADKYSTLTAKKMLAAGKSAGALKPALSAVSRWIKMYLIQAGFLDGWAGWKIAVISARSNKFKYEELRRLKQLPALREKLKTIIIARPDSIGDVMVTLPVAGVISEELPDARIIFIGRTYTESVIRCCTVVDQFLNMDELAGLEQEQRIKVLRDLNADLIIHSFPDKQLVKWAAQARIPLRLATGKRWHTLMNCNRLTWFSRKNSELHEAALNLRMLARVGLKDRLPLAEMFKYSNFSRIPTIPEEISALLDADKPHVILHPKSKGSAVEWGLAAFSKLAGLLTEKGVQVLITGTAAERQLIGNGLPWDNPNVVDLCGKMDLNGLIAVISKADGLVAASTGPLHIAAACGIRAVGLYSPKRPIHPGRWSPIGPKATYITAPEHPESPGTLDIAPEEVLASLGF